MACAREKDAAAAAGVHMKISGYDVRFPFKPYASQLVRRPRDDDDVLDSMHPRLVAPPSRRSLLPLPSSPPRRRRVSPRLRIAQGVMGKVLKAFDNGENALLESPTGSGKSLALLCSGASSRDFGHPLSRVSPPSTEPNAAQPALTPSPSFPVRTRQRSRGKSGGSAITINAASARAPRRRTNRVGRNRRRRRARKRRHRTQTPKTKPFARTRPRRRGNARRRPRSCRKFTTRRGHTRRSRRS